MKEIRYETDITKNFDFNNSIFLAGPTVRGHQTHLQPSWRFEACRILKNLGFTGSVIIPEFEDVTKADKGNEDWIVPWEYKGLSNASCIIFWIPRTKELIGLNTNFEFGFWLAWNKYKMIYGRPEGSYRNKYLDIMWKEITKYSGGDIHTTLEGCCKEAMEIFFNPLV